MTIDKDKRTSVCWFNPSICPMPVEKQVAILYCGTHGLLHNVPLDKVTEFEERFLSSLELNHRADVLDVLKAGMINDEVMKILEDVAATVAKQFA